MPKWTDKKGGDEKGPTSTQIKLIPFYCYYNDYIVIPTRYIRVTFDPVHLGQPKVLLSFRFSLEFNINNTNDTELY